MRLFTKEIIQRFPEKPWLVIGKGPSFSSGMPQGYNTIGLNHVSYMVNVDICVLMDADVLSLEIKSDVIACPMRPHINFKPSNADSIFSLASPELWEKIYFFNSSTWKGRHFQTTEFPIIPVRYFSAEAAFGLLIASGIGTIYSIGIDGGREYATEFSHLKPLTNGQPSFDKGIQQLTQLCQKNQVTWNRLHCNHMEC